MSVSKPLAFLFDWLESRHEVSRGDTKPASHFVVIVKRTSFNIKNAPASKTTNKNEIKINENTIFFLRGIENPF